MRPYGSLGGRVAWKNMGREDYKNILTIMYVFRR
jgi:hypothetical protein